MGYFLISTVLMRQKAALKRDKMCGDSRPASITGCRVDRAIYGKVVTSKQLSRRHLPAIPDRKIDDGRR